MKIVTVVGARPQFIKAAAVRRAIEAHNHPAGRRRPKKTLDEILVHTGQHYDHAMDGVFFEELDLPKPDYHLGVGSGSHAKQTALMLERIEGVLQKERPDAVMVYGDTNSTLAGALTAAKFNIPVVHVEAGLRSYNRTMPEETNRVVTDHLAKILFCPTRQSVENLHKEGIMDGEERLVKRVGDVMYDSILYYSTAADKTFTILNDLNRLTTHDSRLTNYYLATLHRAENTDDPKKLKSILTALDRIGKETPVILPLHPRTRKMINTWELRVNESRVRMIDPVSYLDMIALSRHARVILTDSGGLQKEAYWLGIPCVTLRQETEWVETVRSGWNVLTGTDVKKITEAVRHWQGRELPKKGTGRFGDGRAGERIVRVIADCVEPPRRPCYSYKRVK
jgi:UDP-GlcNAc3NAcA epimerase